MSQPWDISIAQGAGGPVRLAGKATGEPSGGSPTITREILTSTQRSIPAGDSGYLNFTSHASGDTLLVLTDPLNPAVIASGVYCVMVEAVCADAATVGSTYTLLLSMDDANEAPNLSIDSSPVTAANAQPKTSISMTYYIPAGGTIAGRIINFDSQDRDFRFGSCVVQRLS